MLLLFLFFFFPLLPGLALSNCEPSCFFSLHRIQLIAPTTRTHAHADTQTSVAHAVESFFFFLLAVLYRGRSRPLPLFLFFFFSFRFCFGWYMFIVGFLFEKLASEHWFLQVSCLCGGASLLSNIGCLFGSGVGMGRVLSKALLRGGRFGHGEQDGCGSEFVIGDFLDRRHLDRHFHSLPLSALRDIRGCRRAEKSLIDTETGTHQVGIGLGKGYFTFFSSLFLSRTLRSLSGEEAPSTETRCDTPRHV